MDSVDNVHGLSGHCPWTLIPILQLDNVQGLSTDGNCILNCRVNSQIWPELIQDFMAVLVTCKFEDIRSKLKALSSGQHFLHYKSTGKIFLTQG